MPSSRRRAVSVSLWLSDGVLGCRVMEKPPKIQSIFPKGFWDRPSARSKGNSDPDEIAQAVGYALSNWEQVDQQMANIFIAMTGCRVRHGQEL